MTKSTFRTILLLLVAVIAISSCAEQKHKIHYKTKFRKQHYFFHYRGGGQSY